MTEKWYKLDITCATCGQKGKTVIIGALLSQVPIQTKDVNEFLAKHNDAVFICNECSEVVESNARSKPQWGNDYDICETSLCIMQQGLRMARGKR